MYKVIYMFKKYIKSLSRISANSLAYQALNSKPKKKNHNKKPTPTILKTILKVPVGKSAFSN